MNYNIKQFLRDAPVKRKLNVISLTTCAFALVLTCVVLFAVQTRFFRQAMAHDLSALGEVVAASSTAAVSFNDQNTAKEVVNTLTVRPEVDAAAIILPNGTRFVQFGTTNGLSLGPTAAKFSEVSFRDGNCLVSQPIIYRSEALGTLVFRANYAAQFQNLVLVYSGLLGLILAGTFLIAMAISARLHWLITDPIDDLSDAVRRITEEKNYSARAVRHGGDELGKLTDAFNGMLNQIHERDQALRASEERFRQLAESVREVFWMTDPKKSEMIYISPSYEQVWGRTCASLYANPQEWIEAIHPADKERVLQAISKQVIGKYDEEYRIRWPSGSEHWIRDRAFPVKNERGEVYRVVGVADDITARKMAEQELAVVNKQFVDISRQAGMAEVATGVLHNVGNVLNSVNVSATLVVDKLRGSKVGNLGKLATLFREQNGSLANYLTTDPKGRQVPGYLCTLAEHLTTEQNTVVGEMELLRKNIDHIKDIVAMQQNYAKISGVVETVSLRALIEDALSMNEAALDRHEVQVVREFDEVPSVSIDKHKVLQILVNLIRNAKYALDARGHGDKRMNICIGLNGSNSVKISVSDNGIGIPPENLTRIFGHGFTTKKDGHGFGLHSGALAAKELEGSLTAHSDGLGHGATFTLELPLSISVNQETKS